MWRRRLVQKSYADLVWGLAAFVLLQLGLAVAIEGWLPVLRDPIYAYRAARLAQRTIAAPSRPLTVVMLGSSRVENGLKAADLEARLSKQIGGPLVIFNFGIPGAGPVTNLLNFKRLRADGIRPDLLFLEVVPPLLSGQDPAAMELSYLSADRLKRSELRVLESYHLPVDYLRKEWWQSWALSWYAHRRPLLSWGAPKFLPRPLRLDGTQKIDDSGWLDLTGLDVTPEHLRNNLERTREAYGATLRSFHLGGPACQALRDLLDLCRNEAIATALIWMPEGEAFREMYPPAALPEIQTFLQAVSREYGVPVIDAREWVADNDFADGHHLLDSGATVFTERFGREVLQPILENRRGRTIPYPLPSRVPNPPVFSSCLPAAGQ